MFVGTTNNPLECRQVTCYNCNHQFTWIKRSHEGLSYNRLFLKDNDVEGFLASCPKCNSFLYVFDGLEEGINEYDHRIKYCYSNGKDYKIEEEILMYDKTMKEYEYLWTTEKDQWVLCDSSTGYLIFNQITSMALLIEDNELALKLERIMLYKGSRVIKLGQE